jgi:Ca2+/Na+ antiporter
VPARDRGRSRDDSPEIAVAFESVYRHERPIAVGTLLGSYITDPRCSPGIDAAVGGLAGSDPRPAVLEAASMLVASLIVQSVADWRGPLGRPEGAVCAPSTCRGSCSDSPPGAG